MSLKQHTSLDSLNQNWLVKIKTSTDSRGRLVGRFGFIAFCGVQRAEHILAKAERCKDDVFVYRAFKDGEVRLYRY